VEEGGIFHRLRTVPKLFLLLYDTGNVNHPSHSRKKLTDRDRQPSGKKRWISRGVNLRKLL